jgi:putative hydrolase of the HAD superfamily
MLRAVTFDYWRTLIWEPTGELERVRVQHWVPLLQAAGHPVTESQVFEAHGVAFSHASRSWREGRQYRVEHATADMLGHLRIEASAGLQDALTEAFSAAGRNTPLELAPGVVPALRELRAAGLRLGIICDVGLTPSTVLREHLDRRGLLDLFDHCSFSDEVGHYKPAAEPFRHACAGLGVRPGEAAHVGDQRRTDVAGALAAGLLAVRYTGVFDDTDDQLPSGDVVVSRYDDLGAALGLTSAGYSRHP